jgi:hypothetical protein
VPSSPILTQRASTLNSAPLGSFQQHRSSSFSPWVFYRSWVASTQSNPITIRALKTLQLNSLSGSTFLSHIVQLTRSECCSLQSNISFLFFFVSPSLQSPDRETNAKKRKNKKIKQLQRAGLLITSGGAMWNKQSSSDPIEFQAARRHLEEATGHSPRRRPA